MRNSLAYRIALALSISPMALAAQGVTVESVADVRFQGALGSMMGLAARLGGVNMHNMPSTTHVLGHRMRSDNATSGAIIDADVGRITTIDHKQKTFTSMTFAEMAQAMEKAAAKARDREETPPREGESNVKYSVAVDRTNERQTISGYSAERVFVTVTVEQKPAADEKKTEQSGTMVFLLDQWVSREAPHLAAWREFQRAYAEKAGREFQGQAQAFQMAFSSDARIKDGFDASGKELAKIQGIALRSATYVVVVPTGQPFDRQLALNDAAAAAKADSAKKDEKPRGGLRGLAGAIKAASQDANKQSAPADGPAKQGTLMVVTDIVSKISTGEVAAALFQPPAGYREVKAP